MELFLIVVLMAVFSKDSIHGLYSWSFLFIIISSWQNKKERKVREVGILKKDPEQLRKQIENLGNDE